MELPLGALCASCEKEIGRRASRIARRTAVLTTVLLALYLWWRLPDDPLDVQRVVVVMGIGTWYALTHLVVQRVVREYLR